MSQARGARAPLMPQGLWTMARRGAWLLGAPQARSLAGRGAWPIYAAVLGLGLLTLPPFLFLLEKSFEQQRRGQAGELTLANYLWVFERGAVLDLLASTALFSVGGSALALLLGVSAAWLVERTNAPFRSLMVVAAFSSLAIPAIIKGICWILLLGPQAGVLNTALASLLGLPGPVFNIFSMPGMIFVEGVLWTPVVFLMVSAPFRAMDPALEEAAAACGASTRQTFFRVTLPLAAPSVLAVLLLTFIRSLEAFEVPLLVGTPGRVKVVTTEIFHVVNSGLVPRYGEASAYSVLLTAAIILALVPYYRLTRATRRFATVTGRGYRPHRLDLGRARPLAGLVLLAIPALLVAPVLILAWASLLPFYAPPSLAALASASLDNYRRVLQHPAIVAGVTNSVIVGASAATAVALLAALAAWLVARGRVAGRWAIDVLASLPLVFPGIVLGISVLQMFLALPLPLYGTVWILAYAFLVRFLPYGMRYAYAGVLSVHEELEESARVSGATTLTTLRKIVLPLIWPAVAAAWVYVFLLTVRELSVSVLLAGPRSQVASVVILDLWQNGQITELGAFSVLFTLALVALMLLFWRGTQRYGYHG